MSAKVQVEGDRIQKCSRSTAHKKVARGTHRWLDDFTIALIIIPALIAIRPFRYGPSASFTDWQPRPSMGYLVMQLQTGKALTP